MSKLLGSLWLVIVLAACKNPSTDSQSSARPLPRGDNSQPRHAKIAERFRNKSAFIVNKGSGATVYIDYDNHQLKQTFNAAKRKSFTFAQITPDTYNIETPSPMWILFPYDRWDVRSKAMHSQAGVIAWGCNDQSNQKITLYITPNRTWKFMFGHSFMCATITRKSKQEGASISQETCNDGDVFQEWEIIDSSDTSVKFLAE